MSTLTSTDRALHDFAAQVGAEDPIAVEGNRTRWHLGGPLDESARLVKAPTGIVDYQPSEIVVTVRDGTTVAELHDTLAAAGLQNAVSAAYVSSAVRFTGWLSLLTPSNLAPIAPRKLGRDRTAHVCT